MTDLPRYQRQTHSPSSDSQRKRGTESSQQVHKVSGRENYVIEELIARFKPSVRRPVHLGTWLSTPLSLVKELNPP